MTEPRYCEVKQAFCYCQERCIEEDEDELVHNDHPLRHFDRTCPACLAAGKEQT